jgi:hypothetical protein
MEVKLSRLVLLMFIAFGALFFFAGLSFAFGWIDIETTNPVGMAGFNVFAISVGLLLIISQGWYVVFPPTLMKISRDSISFGTGMRYKQFEIPIKYYKNSEINSMGLSVYFTADESIPSSKATSAGIGYFNYCLTLGKLYMDKKPGEVVDYLKSIKQS